MSVTQQQVLAAIADLPGPDASKTLAQSGALGGVNVRDGKVFVSINVEPGKVQALEPMRGRVESVIKKLPGVAAAYVTLTAEGEPGAHKPQPVRTSGAGHSHGHSHGQPKPQASGGAARIGKIVAVASGKGGVGKSTTSANVALAFKKQGLKVGVIGNHSHHVPRQLANALTIEQIVEAVIRLGHHDQYFGTVMQGRQFKAHADGLSPFVQA